VRFTEHLTAKGVDEINRELKTDDLRHKHGPFYQLVSKEGILEDDFVKCGTMDLIEYANKEVLKVLIIGKPRTGKSTLARNL
jgi:predicted GTPase